MNRNAPRLRFSDADRANPQLAPQIRKAEKAANKADRAQARIPKKHKKSKALSFEDVDKKKPPSKLSHTVKDAPGNAVLTQFHREIRKSEDDNVSLKAAHRSSEAAESSVRTARNFQRSHKLKPYRDSVRAEKRLDKANIGFLQQKSIQRNPQLSSNPFSRWQQKQAIKREYIASKAGKSAQTAQKTTATAGKAIRRAAEQAQKALEFIARHKKVALMIGALFIVTIFLMNTITSCSTLFQSGLQAVGATTFPSTDDAMIGAEAVYEGKESALQYELDNYATLHPGYDEYNYSQDSIWHDPYVLISIVTAWQGGVWTLDEVQDTLSMLFEKQYQLKQDVVTEVRYRSEEYSWTDSQNNTHTGTREVAYNYYICNVTLHNENLSHLPVFIMGEDQVGMYAAYIATHGNRPDLFPQALYPHASGMKDYMRYDVPKQYLADPVFAAIHKEAEKYLGFPYVWGGSDPTTSFDCSGFVSWVINHSGWNVGRLGAQALHDMCTTVSAADVKPGDLVFFEKTYDVDGVSHVGIYMGDGMMIHCGDPISYTNLSSSYWQSHFYSYGRLPGN